MNATPAALMLSLPRGQRGPLPDGTRPAPPQ